MNKFRITVTFMTLFFCAFLLGCYSYYSPDSKFSSIDPRSYKDMVDKKLEWSDFAGRPNYSTTLPSRLYCVMRYRKNWREPDSLEKLNGDFSPKPEAIASYGVLPDRSWVKSKYRSAELLHHEQSGLEITKLCALEFKKTIATVFPDYSVSWDHNVDSTFKSIVHKWIQIQGMYEKDTRHGENKQNQMVWDKKIQSLIAKIQD